MYSRDIISKLTSSVPLEPATCLPFCLFGDVHPSSGPNTLLHSWETPLAPSGAAFKCVLRTGRADPQWPSCHEVIKPQLPDASAVCLAVNRVCPATAPPPSLCLPLIISLSSRSLCPAPPLSVHYRPYLSSHSGASRGTQTDGWPRPGDADRRRTSSTFTPTNLLSFIMFFTYYYYYYYVPFITQ